MNKKEIEKDIEILKYYETQDYFFSKDMPALHAFRRAISCMEQQLNNGWIQISPETNPKKSDIYLVTFEENGNRYTERFYYSVISGWMMPVHWQDEGHIDKILYWCNMLEPCMEVSE